MSRMALHQFTPWLVHSATLRRTRMLSTGCHVLDLTQCLVLDCLTFVRGFTMQPSDLEARLKHWQNSSGI
jgi:hypothetical protein